MCVAWTRGQFWTGPVGRSGRGLPKEGIFSLVFQFLSVYSLFLLKKPDPRSQFFAIPHRIPKADQTELTGSVW